MEFATIALDIAQHSDPVAARQRIVDLAREKIRCQGAAIWHQANTGGVHVDACTDPDAVARMAAIAREEYSLAAECLRTKSNVIVEDFTVEHRWPEYVRRVMTDMSVRSAAGFYLGVDERDVGVLVLYSDKPHALDMDQMALGGIFAAHAAIALEDACNSTKAENLALALQSNRRIGMAMGILIATHHVNEQQAFDLMRVTSQTSHVKMHQVAEEIILTGALPTYDPRTGEPIHS